MTVADLCRRLRPGVTAAAGLTYSAAYFAEVLRGGPQRGEVSLDGLATIARRAADATRDPAVRDLVDVIGRARELD